MELLVEDTRCTIVSPKEIPSLQTAITSTSDQTVSWVVDDSYFHLIRISKQHQLFTWTPLTNHISCLHTLNVTLGRSLLPQHSPFGKCQSYVPNFVFEHATHIPCSSVTYTALLKSIRTFQDSFGAMSKKIHHQLQPF